MTFYSPYIKYIYGEKMVFTSGGSSDIHIWLFCGYCLLWVFLLG